MKNLRPKLETSARRMTVNKLRHSITTKVGDGAKTQLRAKALVSKADVQVACLGELDELMCALGVLGSYGLEARFLEQIYFIQGKLFELGAEISGLTPKLDHAAEAVISEVSGLGELGIFDADVVKIEGFMNAIDVPALTHFILPGGEASGAWCHMVRAISRRAERSVVCLHDQMPLRPQILQWMNRLSDYLFLLARALNLKAACPEQIWSASSAVGKGKASDER